MQATIRYRYQKKCNARYNIYYNGQKLQNGKTYDMQPEGIFEIQQDSIFLSLFWIIGLLINLVCGFFGSFDDYRGESSVQRIMTYRYSNPSQELVFEFSQDNCTIQGLQTAVQLQNVAVPNYTIQQRIKISRLTLILVPTIILLTILIMVMVVLDKK